MSNSAKPAPIRRRALVPKEACPMALATEILGDRWTMLILREAFYGVQRYDDIREDLEAPRSTLTDRLSKMVESGLMTRKAYQEPGARKREAYILTDAGKQLGLTLMALSQWGEEHALGCPSPVEMVDKKTGRPLRVALVNDKGKVVEPDKATMVKRQP